MVAVGPVPVVEPPRVVRPEPCLTVGGLDDRDLGEAPLELLERALIQGWSEQSSHMARWLAVLAAFDEREGWGGLGIMSCAHWLSINCGISPRTAADHVRVARRLAELAAVRAAFAAGRITYSKVRAICRVATPDTEAELLELAANTAAGQLERVLREVERQRRGDGLSEDEKEMRRSIQTWTDDQGMAHLEVIAHPDEIELIKRGIDFGRDQLYRERRVAEKDETARCGPAGGAGGDAEDAAPPRREAPSRVDSLLWTVRAGLERLEGDPTYAPSSPYVIMIHVKEGSALVGDDGMVALSGGFTIHPRRLQELACDSTLRLLIQGRDGEEDCPLDVGRTKRLITDKQRAALLAVYDSCDFEGCGVPARFCQWHHVEHWIRGGTTNRSNLRPVCRRHHRLAHTKGMRVVIGPRNQLVALRPDNTTHAGDPTGGRPAAGNRSDFHPDQAAPTGPAELALAEPLDGTELVACNLTAGIDVGDGDELRARWGGEPITPFAADVIISHLVQRLDETSAPVPDTATDPADDDDHDDDGGGGRDGGGGGDDSGGRGGRGGAHAIRHRPHLRHWRQRR